MRRVGETCGLLMDHCEKLGLTLTHAHLKRFYGQMDSLTSFGDIHNFLVEIQQRVWDELEKRICFVLPEKQAAYFEKSEFAQSVFERFPDATFDIDEAGKCLALERSTACVFHLMRVTEYGLRDVGRLLGIKEERPNWEPVIAKIDSELKKDYKDRQFKGQADLLAHISAHFNAVKVAWRNRAMHIDRKHTMEEAKEIYDATNGLMRYLAENLPKPSTGTVAVIREKLGL